MYRIKDWYRLFENNRTRELKHMDWVPVPNKMDGTGYTELVDHPNAAAHLGAWLAIIEIASRQKIRGNFPQVGAGIPQSLSGMSQVLCRISRLPCSVFEELIPRLLQMEWLEPYQQVTEIPQVGAEIPQVGAEIPQVGAGPSRDTRAVTEGKGTTKNTPPTPSTEEFQEISDAYDRHQKHHRLEPRDIVIQNLLSMNGKFNWDKFRANHKPYCDHYAVHGWDFCTLTLVGWIDAGMPGSPGSNGTTIKKPRPPKVETQKYAWTPELMAKADALAGDEQKQFERETQAWIDRMNSGESSSADGR